MDRKDIIEKLEKIFRKVFEDKSITLTEQMTPSDLEKWDSLHQVMLMAEIQDIFGVKYKPKEVKALKNVGLMMDSIEEKMGK